MTDPDRYFESDSPVVVSTQPWLLIMGGLTREGFSRSMRLVHRAADLGLEIVWFDGHPEAKPTIPLGSGGCHIRYSAAEQATWPARWAAGPVKGAGRLRILFWRLLGRRLGGLLRPFAGWAVLRPHVKSLMTGEPPSAIAFCDDFSITSAWHASKIWPDSRIVSMPSDL